MVLENGHQTLFPVYIGGMPCLNFSNVLTHCVCSLYSRIFCTAGKDHPSLAECSVFIIAPFTTEQEPGHYTYYFHCTWKVTKWQIFTDVTKQAFKQRMCNISWIYQHLQIDWHKPGVCTMCRCGDMWKYRRITNGHLMWTNPDCQYVHICTLHKHWRLVTYARCQKGERRIQLGITLSIQHCSATSAPSCHSGSENRHLALSKTVQLWVGRYLALSGQTIWLQVAGHSPSEHPDILAPSGPGILALIWLYLGS